MRQLYLSGPLAIVVVVLGFTKASGQMISPDGSPILAQGPLPITLTMTEIRKDTVKEKGTLLFLTQSGLYYYKTAGGVQLYRPAKSFTACIVETTEEVTLASGKKGTAYWRLDDKANPPAFEGDKLPFPVPDLTPCAGNKPIEEIWFLYHALAHLNGRVEAALNTADKTLLDYYAARAKEIALYMNDNRLDTPIKEAYGTIPKYIEEQATLSANLDDLYVSQAKKYQELFARARYAESRKRQEQLAGGLLALLGALNADPYNVTYRDNFSGDTFTRREYQSNPDFGAIFSGVGTFLQAQSNYQSEMTRLAIAKQAFDADSRAKYSDWYGQLIKNRKERAELLRTIGIKQLQLEPVSPLDRLPEVQNTAIKSKNPKLIIDLYEEQAKYERGTGPWDNPFALCALYDTKAMTVGKGQNRSNELFALALQAVETVRLVPPGELFNFERMELLRMAARLACEAAKADTYKGYWSRAYSPRAAFAVWLLDHVGPIDKLDVSGEVREQRAIALLLVGRIAEALRQALAVSSLRDSSGTYHYNVARLYSAQFLADNANGIPRKEQPRYAVSALDSIEKAMKNGFCDIRELKNKDNGGTLDSDFIALFTAPETKDRMIRITKLEINCSLIRPTKMGDPYYLRLVNKSSFTITNPIGEFNVWDAKNAKHEIILLQQPPSIPPGKEAIVELKDPSAYLDKKLNLGKVTLTCEQGKIEVKQ